MREVLIGSGGSRCRAEKQPSGQTRQHQSAPVTRASTIGANIAILPAFTSGQEKPNARPRHRWAGFPIRLPPPPFERGHRSIRPVCSPYYSLVPSTFPSPPPRPLYTYIYIHMYLPLVFLVEEKIFSRGEIAVRRGEGIPFYTLVPKMVGARWMLVLRIRTRIGIRFRGEKKGKKSEKSRNNATRNDRLT